MRRVLSILLILILLSACRSLDSRNEDLGSTPNASMDPTPTPPDRSQLVPSPTPSPTASSTATPTPEPTSTPTPTATPVAQAISVTGDPRNTSLAKRSDQEETGCGYVDLLDFPINPPDGNGVARGGTDFGVYRSRYEQYHTGEDWWTSRGGSFGTPVYSIGRGRVTYAAPLGWGRDQGVVVIRHTFEDGRQILSFYGHLDPPSVELVVGECVERSQQIGKIGRPRTPPHLHFEIRTHMPNEPGGGYWWQDPTLDGWLPPSVTIWQERMASSPGVNWLRAPKAQDTKAIGSLDKNTFLMIEDGQVIGLDSENGELLWSFAPEIEAQTAVVDATQPILYVADRAGRVEAFQLPDMAESDSPAEASDPLLSLWQIDLDAIGFPELLQLPDGGFVLAAWHDAVGVSDEGDILWRSEEFDRLQDWAVIGDELVLSTIQSTESLWIANEDGLSLWKELSGGALASSLNDQGLLLNSAGLSRLNPGDRTSTLLSEWPSDGWRESDVIGLKDGGALVTYVGRSERRLIRFDADGAVIWQRSLSDRVSGVPRLFTSAEQAYLWTVSDSDNTEMVSVYAIDLQRPGLKLLFSGGTRTATRSLNSSIFPLVSETTFLNIGGGHLVSLDLIEAADIIGRFESSLPQRSIAVPSDIQGT